MARNNRNNENQEKMVMNLEAVNATVTNAREWKDGGVSFTLKCDGFSFYNLSIQSTRDGKRFIAPPCRKGKDGNYYPLYALYLSDDDTKGLIDEVYTQIDEAENDRRERRGRR